LENGDALRKLLQAPKFDGNPHAQLGDNWREGAAPWHAYAPRSLAESRRNGTLVFCIKGFLEGIYVARHRFPPFKRLLCARREAPGYVFLTIRLARMTDFAYIYRRLTPSAAAGSFGLIDRSKSGSIGFGVKL
jgi:hypothetical protein